ncbi:MAG: heavy metal translocating P-type ATPase [Acidobacteria bacterium]|nr:heavy metal translocating P-type ATPase [Acidobacteriota bacterium]
MAHPADHDCTAHNSKKDPRCVCDHNPGGECHCPPNECKCDQEHHLVGQTQEGHNCCATGGEHQSADAKAHAGHDHSGHDHSHHDPDLFKKQVLFSTALTIPAVYFSHTVQMLLGYQALSFPGSNFIPAVAGIILFFTSARIFLTTGWQEVKSKKPGMMALIALALTVAFGYSLFLTVSEILGFNFGHMDFWWELATLTTIMLVGHWIEMSAIMSASNALGELKSLLPDTALKVSGKTQKVVPVGQIVIGDQILVSPGAAVPVDGVVISGSAKLNESMLTGESALVEKSVGDSVFAGTTVSTDDQLRAGSLVIRATGTGANTAFSQILKLVEQAQQSKSKTQRLADQAAGWLFYVALLAAFITAIYWAINGSQSIDFVLERIVTVLVIACPHALGLAIPLVTSITTAKAATSGLLIRNRQMFEQAAKLHAVLFDKTGTLTEGRRGVSAVRIANKSKLQDEDKILAMAAALEFQSEHSIGRAIVQAANERELKLPKVTKFEALAGKGVSGKVGRYEVLVGSPALLVERNYRMEVIDLVWADQATASGSTVICLVVDGILEGLIKLGDVIRQSSAEAVYELQRERIRVGILTGDARGVAEYVAKEISISEVYAEALPWQKTEVIKKLQSDKSVVGFVGDGINDAPALAQADVSFAIGAGTNVAIESAGIVLISDDPAAVVRAVKLSKRVRSKSLQNLWWAAGYNILAIPLAAGLFMPLGLVLTPALGAVLMSLSTLIVAVNAQTLRKN